MSLMSSSVRLGALLLVLATAVPAYAQDPLDRVIGLPVVAVTVQVEGRSESAAALLALIDLKIGDPLTLEGLRRVEGRLSRVPRFERVAVLAVVQPGGVEVIFDLTPRHPVDRLEFAGDLGVPRDELDQLVRDEFGGLPTGVSLGEVEDAVRRVLGGAGYRSAAVRASTVPTHDPDRATLLVDVTAGPATRIARSEVRGSSPLAAASILERLGAEVGHPFRDRDLATRLAEIRDELRGLGFYEAIAQYTPTFSADGIEVSLLLTVDAGPLVRVQIVGELPGREDDLIPIKRQGSVDSDLLDDSRAAIELALRRLGYWRARVRYERFSQTPEALVIVFTIDRGKRYRIERVDLPAGLQMTVAAAGKQPGLVPGAWFSQEAAERGLLFIKAAYQQQGYYMVVMDPEYAEVSGKSADEGGVVIRPNVTEGPRADVARITFDLAQGSVVSEQELRSVMRAREQEPYVGGDVLRDQYALLDYYESRGFLSRSVTVTANLDPGGTTATISVAAREGPQVRVGEIDIVGNSRVKRDVILEEITLAVGAPYSDAARVESQRRLYNLGSFKSVRITLEPRLPDDLDARVTISVEESAATTLGYGGGLVVGSHPRSIEGGGIEDRIEVSPRGFVEIGRRNLGGRNRAVTLFSRVALKPTDAPGDPSKDGKGFGFAEYRFTGTYRERYAFQSPTDLLLSATSEQGIRTSFNFSRQALNADLLRTLNPRLSVSGRYSLEFTRLFDERIPPDEQSLIDRLFPQVRLSILSTGVFWDRRDDQIKPSRGSLVSGSGDLALRPLGSEVGFVKTFVQATWYKSLVASKRLVFATRVQLGLARGFERTVEVKDENGNPVLGPDGQPLVETVADLPASQRFFAGGSTTVRGFQLDRLGAPEILNPDGLSDGGNAMFVLNAELRAHVGRIFRRDFGVVGFVDGGNVFDRVGDLNLGRLRGTSGFGLRYDSPLGPLRLDVGYKWKTLVFKGGREKGWDLYFSIGEAF